ncbi:formylglycine-generating enzyme family protein [Pseudomonas sp. CR3202]|uniref:formylglycine-generating enzyme family protein n=1 Tax=Pseudomonas sp. CR3202 TaxID=3351532 RepID=UPI003BF1B83D
MTGHPAGMCRLAGGTFTMGSERFYREERPLREVRVEPFRLDPGPVTNAQFARFVAETGYRTQAELPLPGQPGHRAGSLVFRKPDRPVPLHDPSFWWQLDPAADWRHPEGAGSGLTGRQDHPVVHITHRDAQAYAAWAGKRLPSEAEWEFAARGGLAGADYAWGDELLPEGRQLANFWRGDFPWHREDGLAVAFTTAVGHFPANPFGLFDMIGNVWEWTADDYAERATSCPSCAAGQPALAETEKVIKGGSFLCAPSYCQRYRPAARQGLRADGSASHIGFRCAVSEAAIPAP